MRQLFAFWLLHQSGFKCASPRCTALCKYDAIRDSKFLIVFHLACLFYIQFLLFLFENLISLFGTHHQYLGLCAQRMTPFRLCPMRMRGPALLPTPRQHCRAMSRDTLRRGVERFWQPFMVGKRGEDFFSYHFRENLNTIRTPDSDFTCQVNGSVGGALLLEDFFVVLLCGFDIMDVTFAWKSSLYDPCLSTYCGSYTLVHSRPFLGWKPPTDIITPPISKASHTLPKLENSSVVTNSRVWGGSRLCDNVHETQIHVPFSMYVEGGGSHELLSHIVLRSQALRYISRNEECPEDVQECLSVPAAVNMLASLRRAYVDPAYITAEALLSATEY